MTEEGTIPYNIYHALTFHQQDVIRDWEFIRGIKCQLPQIDIPVEIDDNGDPQFIGEYNTTGWNESPQFIAIIDNYLIFQKDVLMFGKLNKLDKLLKYNVMTDDDKYKLQLHILRH